MIYHLDPKVTNHALHHTSLLLGVEEHAKIKVL